jgi:hypothetical protein
MSIVNRITAFVRSPKGQQYADKAKRMAQDPRTQAKAKDLLAKFRGRSGR